MLTIFATLLDQSGLDYTKLALIKNLSYIDNLIPAVHHQVEYIEVAKNHPQIVREV